MTTEYKLNQLIKWTAKDRAKGECPVPAGSDVTIWYVDETCQKTNAPTTGNWSDSPTYSDELITAYLVHSVPRKSFVLWYAYEDNDGLWCLFHDKEKADDWVSKLGGRVVKLVEEME